MSNAYYLEMDPAVSFYDNYYVDISGDWTVDGSFVVLSKGTKCTFLLQSFPRTDIENIEAIKVSLRGYRVDDWLPNSAIFCAMKKTSCLYLQDWENGDEYNIGIEDDTYSTNWQNVDLHVCDVNCDITECIYDHARALVKNESAEALYVEKVIYHIKYTAEPVPGPPTGVSASDGTYSDRVLVSWNSSSGATSYKVYRATSSGGSKTLVQTTTGTSYSDYSVSQGTTYYYFVTACNSTGCSAYSSYNSGYAQSPAPIPPTGVSASDGTYSDRVLVSWNSSSGATSYKVYRATSSGGSKTLVQTTTGTSYSDYSVSQGTTYYYFVTACNSTGCSAYSSYNSGYAQSPAPIPPTGVSASDGTYSDRVLVSWNSSSGATSYKVYRATSSGGSKTLVQTTTGTSYSDYSVSQGTTYYYFVTACNSTGCSAYSSYNSGYPQDDPACSTNAIFPTNWNFPSEGGYVDVAVDMSASDCSWTVSESLSWITVITVSKASGRGDGAVRVTAQSNSGSSRSGTVTIAGKSFAVSQDENIDFAIYVPNDYPTIQEAVNNAIGQDIILIAKTEEYFENITIQGDKIIKLYGGWESDFSLCESYSTIYGSLTVSRGTAVVENLILAPFNLLVSTRDGIMSVNSNGEVSNLIDASRYFEVNNDNIFILGHWEIEKYDKNGTFLESIPIPNQVEYYLEFTLLPDCGFALFDNDNDKIYFLNAQGDYLHTASMLVSQNNSLQNVEGKVVDNYLIVSENGNNQLIKVDLSSFETSVFRDFSHIAPWLGAVEYSNGVYYLSSSRSIYSFTENQNEILIATLPDYHITDIVVKNNYAYATVNFGGKIYRVNLSTGEWDVFCENLDYPKDLED